MSTELNQPMSRTPREEAPEAPSPFGRLRHGSFLGAVCALVALVPIVAICLVQPPLYAMLIDECVQVLYARGEFLAEASGMLMPYSLAPVSVPLGLLYQALPQVPWYPLMLLGLIEASFSIAFARTARSRMSDPMCLTFLVVLLACEIVTVLYLTYTIVAFFAVAAGLMLLLPAAFERSVSLRPADVCGLLMIFFGYALRPESGQVVFVLFAPFMVWVLVKNRRIGAIARGVAAVLCVVLATVVGQLAYNGAAGWEDFTAYLDAGRSSLDYPDLTASEIQEILPELSENDAEMLIDWMFVDEGTYPVSLFERFGSERPHYSMEYLLGSFEAKTTYATIALVAMMGVLAWLVMSDVGASASRRVLALGVIAMLLASCLMLIMRERVRLHVMFPLVVTALLAMVMCASVPAESAGGHFKAVPSGLLKGKMAVAVPVAACVCSLALCAGFWYAQIRPEQAKMSAPTTVAMRDYIEENPNQVIVLNRTQSVFYYGAGTIFDLESWEFPENVITIGGWERETAPWNAALERFGLSRETTLADMVDREDCVMIIQDYDLPQVEQYLTEHVGEQVTAEQVEDLGPGLRATDRRILVVRFVTSA